MGQVSVSENGNRNAFGFDPIEEVQILTPMNRGVVGTANLNAELQNALNPREDGVTRGRKNFRVDDKVMLIRNNYDKEVFNGDIGRNIRIDTEMQEPLSAATRVISPPIREKLPEMSRGTKRVRKMEQISEK